VKAEPNIRAIQWRFDQHDLVAPDTFMPISYSRQGCNRRQFNLRTQIEYNEIVARAMHLNKGYCRHAVIWRAIAAPAHQFVVSETPYRVRRAGLSTALRHITAYSFSESIRRRFIFFCRNRLLVI
jgi:hypothetical protein